MANGIRMDGCLLRVLGIVGCVNDVCVGGSCQHGSAPVLGKHDLHTQLWIWPSTRPEYFIILIDDGVPGRDGTDFPI